MSRLNVLICCLTSSVFCGSFAVASGLHRHIPQISFSVEIPPALVVVQDAGGHQSGVDASKPVTTYGFGSILDGIPGSRTRRENVANDDADKLGQPSSHTIWSISIGTSVLQTYSVSLTGIATGICTLTELSETATQITGGADVATLMSPGVVRVLRVVFDPIMQTVATQRVVNGTDLVMDIDTACRLEVFGTSNRYIEPDGVYQSLRAKAEAATADLQRGDKPAARGSLGAFLNELKAQGNKHIKEPALTILREEAEALLVTLNASAMKNKAPASKGARQ